MNLGFLEGAKFQEERKKVPSRLIIVCGRKTLGSGSRDLSWVGMNFLCQLASEGNSAGRVKWLNSSPMTETNGYFNKNLLSVTQNSVPGMVAQIL